MKFWKSFHPYAFTTVFFWSMSYILTRLSLQHFTAFPLGFLRYLIASIVLAAVAVATKMKPPRLADFPWFLAAGGTGFFFYMIAFNQGQAKVSASTGSVVIATVPVITALLARFFYRETLRPYQWAAIIIAFCGVAVLALQGSALSVNTGLIWLLLAALALSVYNLLQRRLTKVYTALQASTYSIFFGTLLLAIFAPASFRELPHTPAVQYLYLAIMGIGSSALAYVTWSVAFSKAKQTSQVSNYMFVTPFLASVLGFLIAGEIPDRATLFGGGMILSGMVIFNFGKPLARMLQRQKI